MNEATNTVITAADRSVKAINAATGALSKVVSDLAGLSFTAETLAADIQQKESQLSDLDRQLDLKTRNANAELNVRVAEAEGTVLEQLMKKNNLTKISFDGLNTIRTELAQAVADKAAAIESAVKAAESSLHAKYNAQLRDQEANHKVTNAETAAKVTALTERNAFLVEELAKARNDLVAEREARIKIAQAEAARQGVVVNAGKQ